MVENTIDKGHKQTSSNNGDDGANKTTASTAVAKQDVLDALQKHSSAGAKSTEKKHNDHGVGGVNAENILHLTTQVATAYFQNNRVASGDVATIISTIHQSLRSIKNESAPQKKSVVSIGDSLTPDYIICLEDGKKLKMLKRHLRTNFNMSPTEYRAKWGLPPDYPMVAPNYANLRSQFAKQSGLGKERGERGKNKS
ncbi:MAG: MucR family transcriptional regulator [Hydrotalea sp.]|nr:MucR family transcriptional regulator [Hydrotalea sp.]